MANSKAQAFFLSFCHINPGEGDSVGKLHPLSKHDNDDCFGKEDLWGEMSNLGADRPEGQRKLKGDVIFL